MRTYEINLSRADDPATLPDLTLAATLYRTLRRLLPDAGLAGVGIGARTPLGGRTVVIRADVPEHRPTYTACDDPALERVAVAVRRALHLADTPDAAASFDSGLFFAACGAIVTTGEVAA